MSTTLLTPPPANLGELPHFGEELRHHRTGVKLVVHSICITKERVLCTNGVKIPIRDLDYWDNLSRPAVECTVVSSDRFP